MAFLFLKFASLDGQEGKIGVLPIDKRIGKQWAVFIAIDRYDEWGTLGNPVRDAKEIRDILVGNYLIHEIRELYNNQATGDNVRNLFTELGQKTGVYDSVFVFYAGAGQVDKFTKAGSWILMPSSEDLGFQTNQMANEEVQNMLASLPAKHVFLISDACFVGEGLDINAGNRGEFRNDEEYYKQVYNKVSRQVIGSGAVKTGPGSSEFRRYLKNALRDPQGDYIDSAYLFAQVQNAAPPQSQPFMGIITNTAYQETETLLSQGTAHQEGGEFLFFKNTLFAAPMPSPPPISNKTPGTGSVMVFSEAAGMLMIQGVETGTRIRANSSAALWNVTVGEIEVAVKSEDGRIITALPQKATLQEGQTARVVIEYPFMDRFVFIPGGDFVMGSPVSEANRNHDETQHEVTLRDFYMEAHEVSLEDFQKFVSETGYETRAEIAGGGYIWTGNAWKMTWDATWRNPYFDQDSRHPVVLVSWDDAIQYCNWRSEREGLSPAYTITGNDVIWNEGSDGYRLPTEAEWEDAARAGTPTPFSTGITITTAQANFNGNYPYNNGPKGIYREMTTPIDTFSPNWWGLYDMYGNVWEWCWDQYTQSGSSGVYRVRRGGSWSYAGEYLRSAYRSYSVETARYNSTGFRLARSIPAN
ncbi:MAG: SUMF1/EgtB/PvdO family nonheme iron enzyme [Treponema sp.]|nr:SUMF1/EgtB/PvdO family nonheme iron enzyme [Treponema sp.]